MHAYAPPVTTFTRLFLTQGMKQAGAAARFDTTQTTIGRWLKGEVAPSIRRAGFIAQRMELPIEAVRDAIAEGTEPMEAPPPADRVRRADRLDEVLTMLRRVEGKVDQLLPAPKADGTSKKAPHHRARARRPNRPN
jgi:transcriptional regulator with XRE-family HTH domain